MTENTGTHKQRTAIAYDVHLLAQEQNWETREAARARALYWEQVRADVNSPFTGQPIKNNYSVTKS